MLLFVILYKMKISIDKLSPSQISVGYQQVEEKTKVLLDKKKKKNLKEYLQAHPVPVIKGSLNHFYIVDHHHLCCAANNLNIDEVYYTIVADWSTLTTNQFWQKMNEARYIWLFDSDGSSIRIDEITSYLPKSIRDLKNDAYRSLAGMVRKNGGFFKVKVPFSEFCWANFFRNSNLEMETDTIIINDTVFNAAMALARTDKASHLPGFISSKNNIYQKKN